MKPKVGDTVHYVSYGTPGGEFTSQCRAAIVTGTMPDDAVPGDAFTDTRPTTIEICVLNPQGVFFDRQIRHAEPDEHKGGTWHHRERCDQ